MKFKDTILTLLVLITIILFPGCNTDGLDNVLDIKTSYTDAEKAEIYVLADKYELEVLPEAHKSGATLMSVSKLEDMFKHIHKMNNTKRPLIQTKGGMYETVESMPTARMESAMENNTTDFWHEPIASVIRPGSSIYDTFYATKISITNTEVFGELYVSMMNCYSSNSAYDNVTTVQYGSEMRYPAGDSYKFNIRYRVIYANNIAISCIGMGAIDPLGTSYITCQQEQVMIYGI